MIVNDVQIYSKSSELKSLEFDSKFYKLYAYNHINQPVITLTSYSTFAHQ